MCAYVQINEIKKIGPPSYIDNDNNNSILISKVLMMISYIISTIYYTPPHVFYFDSACILRDIKKNVKT